MAAMGGSVKTLTNGRHRAEGRAWLGGGAGMVTGMVTGAWLDGSVDGHWAVTANFWCGE